MAENLLNIAESSQEIQIDEEKLRFTCSKVNIWEHFSISKSQYVSLNSDEKLKMVKGFYCQYTSVMVSVNFVVMIVFGLKVESKIA